MRAKEKNVLRQGLQQLTIRRHSGRSTLSQMRKDDKAVHPVLKISPPVCQCFDRVSQMEPGLTGLVEAEQSEYRCQVLVKFDHDGRVMACPQSGFGRQVAEDADESRARFHHFPIAVPSPVEIVVSGHGKIDPGPDQVRVSPGMGMAVVEGNITARTTSVLIPSRESQPALAGTADRTNPIRKVLRKRIKTPMGIIEIKDLRSGPPFGHR